MIPPEAMALAEAHAARDHETLRRLLAEGKVITRGPRSERAWFERAGRPAVNLAIRPRKDKRKRR